MVTVGQCEVKGAFRPGYETVLTPEALAFVTGLTRRFRPAIGTLLDARRERQEAIDAGEALDFPSETAEIRRASWSVAPLPDDLHDRRVELTGPVDRKTVINGLNAGANCFMADFEDATAPTWENLVEGQINLRAAVAGELTHDDPATGKRYALGPNPAVLFVRPRGLHLREDHVRVDGEPVPGALFDFGLFCFHNARPLLSKGSGPYFYLPKLESHREARLWNAVFAETERRLNLPSGAIKATVLIETLPAVFEMDEILFELKERSAGLNCGRWDYIFSFAKTFRRDPSRVLPDRHRVTMVQPFMRAYTRRLVQVCHRRGVHAMGGMAPQIPRPGEPDLNRAAMEKVAEDKLREVRDGHDGTWVAHPGLIGIARDVFDREMPGSNQIARQPRSHRITAGDLLQTPSGPCTEAGLRSDVRVALRYLAAWLAGRAAVSIDGLMEDAATAEICRTQLWSWIFHRTRVGDTVLEPERFLRVVEIETSELSGPVDEAPLAKARDLLEQLCLSEDCPDFFTLQAYPILIGTSGR